MISLQGCYRLNCVLKILYVEALTSNTSIFEDRAFKVVIKVNNEVLSMPP